MKTHGSKDFSASSGWLKPGGASRLSRSTFTETKVTEKQSEIDRLEQRANNEQATLDGLQTEVAEKRREKYSIDTSNEWKDPALRAVSSYLVATDEVIKFAIEAIQDYAYSGTGGRGGNHGDCF